MKKWFDWVGELHAKGQYVAGNPLVKTGKMVGGKKPEDQVALTLKTVSGFGVQEIAKALVSNEATIQKRLYRAKEYIRTNEVRFEIPIGQALEERLETVYTVLYLLFNEGYNSIKADELIRYDLCVEAMRLCKLLTERSPCCVYTTTCWN